MTKVKASWIKHLDFAIGDVFCLLISYVLAGLLRYSNISFIKEFHYQQMLFSIAIASLITSFVFESYRGILRRGFYKEFRAVIIHICITAIEVMIYLFAIRKSNIIPRGVYIITFFLGVVLMYVFRIGWKRIVKKIFATNPYRSRVLVITKKEFAEDFIAGLLSKGYADYELKGCVLYDQEYEKGEIQGIPMVCDTKGLMEYVKLQVIDEVVIQIDKVTQEMQVATQELVNMGVTVHIELAKIFGEFPDMRAGQFGGYKVITISIHRVKLSQLFIKRTMDIIGGVVGLIITGIIFVIIAPTIKIQSTGPVFFAQERVGRNGRIFKLYKFRSMYADAEKRKKELLKDNKMQGHMFKMDNDPRITPIGHFIRKYSIDEWPQFWNVLKGEMSLVGTRPPTIDEFEQYDKHHRVRLSIKPGITGMWQVNGRSDIVDFEEVVRLDEKYIRDWDLGLDFKILLKTVLVVLGKRGSA